MTRDDIINMIAKVYGVVWTNEAQLKDLEQFAALVASAEREACAVVAEKESLRGLPEEQPEGEDLLRACAQIAGGVLIADAIRARGQA